MSSDLCRLNRRSAGSCVQGQGPPRQTVAVQGEMGELSRSSSCSGQRQLLPVGDCAPTSSGCSDLLALRCSAVPSRAVLRCPWMSDEKEPEVVGCETRSSRRGGNVRIRAAVLLKRRVPAHSAPASRGVLNRRPAPKRARRGRPHHMLQRSPGSSCPPPAPWIPMAPSTAAPSTACTQSAPISSQTFLHSPAGRATAAAPWRGVLECRVPGTTPPRGVASWNWNWARPTSMCREGKANCSEEVDHVI